jgi:hypothetical protein
LALVQRWIGFRADRQQNITAYWVKDAEGKLTLQTESGNIAALAIRGTLDIAIFSATGERIRRLPVKRANNEL